MLPLTVAYVEYRVETFGSASAGSYTPFWMVNNTHGFVPLKQNNAYLRGNLMWEHDFNKSLKVEAGVDLLTAAQHSSSLWAHQLYTGISYRAMKLTIGSKEYYNSFLDKDLSVGDMCYSTNARPIPEINLGFPEYTIVPFSKEIMKFKADFAVGKSMDDDYILRTKNETTNYTTDILWHHKSLFLQWADPQEKFPLSFEFGLVHASQWGGWTSVQDAGKMPSSFSDFMLVVFGKSGKDNALEMDQVNVLGNQLGTMNARLEYKHPHFKASVYKQHFYDDNSGLEYANWPDGIWGGEISFLNQSFVKKVVYEYMNTTNQSGPFHFLEYETQSGVKYRGGGSDNYYNHGIYIAGWSYFGRAIGNPLLTSPEYNDDGSILFKNIRVKSWHLGLNGDIASGLSYRLLFTQMHAWGRMSVPFLKRKNNFSSLIECTYRPSAWKGWSLGFQMASDYGDLYGNNWGCSLKIGKTGVFKTKN